MYNGYLKYFPSLTIPELKQWFTLMNENLFFPFLLLSRKRETRKFSFSPTYTYIHIFQIFVRMTVSLNTELSALRLYRCARVSSLALSIQFHPHFAYEICVIPPPPARPLTRNFEFLNKLISPLFSYIKYIYVDSHRAALVLVSNAEGTSSRRWNI